MPPSDLTEPHVLHSSHKDRSLLLSIFGYVAFHCNVVNSLGTTLLEKTDSLCLNNKELPRAQVGVELDAPALPPDSCRDLV